MAEEKRWMNPLFKSMKLDCGGPFVRLRDNRLMVVQGTAVRTSADEGVTWSGAHLLSEGSGTGIAGNAGQIFMTAGGVVIVTWRDERELNWDDEAGEPGPDDHGDIWAVRSLDDGKTWIDRQRIFEGIAGHPPINLVQTRDGRVVVPIQFVLRNPGRHAICTCSSTDDGASWSASNIIDVGGHGHHDGGFEPTLVELRDGRLWMLIRTNLDRFWEAWSDDGGRYWRELRPTAIDASTSPGYLSRLASGRLVLVWNRLYPEGEDSFSRRSKPYSEVEASWHREELSISFSEDEGQTWRKPHVIAREKDAWIAYPYLFEPSPGLLWVTTGQGNLQASAREQDLVAPE